MMQLSEDLQARQQARNLACSAEQAEKKLSLMSQDQLDKICSHMAEVFESHAQVLSFTITFLYFTSNCFILSSFSLEQ